MSSVFFLKKIEVGFFILCKYVCHIPIAGSIYKKIRSRGGWHYRISSVRRVSKAHGEINLAHGENVAERVGIC